MAFVDDPNQNSEAPVAGPAPLSQSAAPMAEQQPSENTSQQAASGLSGSSQPESQPKGINKGRTATKASSGMFNNINKYVEKNKPQAQKIASAVSQDFNKKAQEIQKSAAQKQQQQQQAIDANQRTLDENRRFAQDQIGRIMNPTAAPVAETVTESAETSETTETKPVIYNPSQEAADRFQELMKGNVEGINATQNLDLSKQKNKAGALQQLADTSETEQGRRNMLGELFRKQGEYTRGMSGLDNLITSGDSQARESLIQNVKDEASGLTSGLQDMQTEAGSAKMAQDLAMANFGTDIRNLSNEQRDMLDQQMKTSLETELANRAKLQEEYDLSKQSIDDYRTQALDRLGDTSNLQNIAGQVLGSGQDLGWRGSEVFSELANDLGNKGGYNSEYYNPDSLRRISENRFRDAINAINQGYQFGGEGDLGVKDDLFSDIWSTSRSTNRSAGDQIFSKQGIKDSFSKLGQSISDIDAQKILDENIRETTKGQDLEQYMTGEGLDQYDVAEQGDVDRYNALQRLIGGEDVIDDQRRQTDFVKQDALQSLLNKFRNS